MLPERWRLGEEVTAKVPCLRLYGFSKRIVALSPGILKRGNEMVVREGGNIDSYNTRALFY